MAGRQVASSASFRNLKVTGNLSFPDGSISSVINNDTSFTPIVTPGDLASNVQNITGSHHSKVGSMNRFVFAADADVAATGGFCDFNFTLPDSTSIIPGTIRGTVSTSLPNAGDIYMGVIFSGVDAYASVQMPVLGGGYEPGSTFAFEVTWLSTE